MRGSAHVAIVQVRVGRDDRPLGGLWVRQLGGLIDCGVDGAGEGVAWVGDCPMGRVPRVMRHFIIQWRWIAKGLGGVVLVHRVLWVEDKGGGDGGMEGGGCRGSGEENLPKEGGLNKRDRQ